MSSMKRRQDGVLRPISSLYESVRSVPIHRELLKELSFRSASSVKCFLDRVNEKMCNVTGRNAHN